jgi:hypothetical protein
MPLEVEKKIENRLKQWPSHARLQLQQIRATSPRAKLAIFPEA